MPRGLRPPTVPLRVCRHCGDRVDEADGIASGGEIFCCQGCRSVFDLLASRGLTAFYTCAASPGRSQRGRIGEPADRFRVLDVPDVRARFVRRGADGRAVAMLPVPDLHCASCVWLLEQLWRFDPGTRRSEVDLIRRIVRVEFDDARTTLSAIATTIARLGYEPAIDVEPAGEIPAARRALYLKLGVAGFAFGNVMLFSIPRYANGAPLAPPFQRLFDALNLTLAVPVLVYSASDYFIGAWRAWRARTVALDVPIAVGLCALFARSAVDILSGRGEGFLDSFSGLVFLLLIGRLFQSKAFEAIAFDRTVRSFLPLSVQRERETGGTEAVSIDDIRPGDVIRLRAQEVIPADGQLLDPQASVDYGFVTGEQAPVVVRAGGSMAAGGRVIGHGARLRARARASQSTLVRLWSDPAFRRTKRRRLTELSDRAGAAFTAGALGLAALGAYAWRADPRLALQVATAVLIIACPCALTLAAPITLGTAMGMLGRRGCFVRQAAVVLDLASVRTVLFDKTGTLTTSDASGPVTCDGLDAESWRAVAALAAHSVHPASRAVAASLADASPGQPPPAVAGVAELPGLGIRGVVGGRAVAIGTRSFVAPREAPAEPDDEAGVTWAVVGHEVGRVTTRAAVRPGIAMVVAAIARRARVGLVSGDRDDFQRTWSQWGRGRGWFRQSPQDKLAIVRAREAAGERVLMVGDGLNDAGAFAAATVGLAVSDDTACMVPACDAVIRGDRLALLPDILDYAVRARRVIALCVGVSVLYNVIGLSLALRGQLTPLATAVLMPVSSLTVVGLSVGLMRWRAPGAAPA